MAEFFQSTVAFTPDALALVGQARLAYIRKVYAYFGFGLLAAIGGSLVAMNSDLVFFTAQHGIVTFVVYLGAFFWAQASANKPTRAVPTMVLFTFISGVILSPLLYMLAHSANPAAGVGIIYDSLFLTALVFGGLTTYVFITKKDFSFLGGALTIGIFVLIGAMLINGFFAHSSSFDLGISVIGTLIMGGFILVDTSRILKYANQFPPTSAALSLYLDFLNLFLFILRILMGSRSRD
jgi:FtsH-binding integral membrane protein